MEQVNLNLVVRISKFSKAMEASGKAASHFIALLGIHVFPTRSFIVFTSLDRFGTLWFALEYKILPLQEVP